MNQIERLAQEALGAVQSTARQGRREYGDEQFVRGFKAAAGISLRRVEEKLDAFQEQMKAAKIPKADLPVYAALVDLKSEFEAEYDRFWRNTDVDWRPTRPVVTGVVRRRTDPLSEE